MNNEFFAEDAKKLIFDEINVTETDPLKSLFQILVKIVLILVMVYFSIFILSGVVIKTMPIKTQIALENFLASFINVKPVDLTSVQKDILNEAKEIVLSQDEKFPKTSNLDINVFEDNTLNALCYPNGTIYITSALYKKITTKEQLVFILAHEMAHYRNKDHLMNLRKNLAGGFVILIVSISGGNVSKQLSELADTFISLTDLKYSRTVEEKADMYAGKILLKKYGSTKGGIEVMNILNSNHDLYEPEALSSHPLIMKRILKLETLK